MAEKSITSELAEDLLSSNLEISDTADESVEEPTEQVEETESSETSEEAKEDEEVITEELAKRFGVSATFIGKPLDELANAFKETKKNYTQTRQEISELKKDFEKLQSQKAEIKEETGIDVSDLPDPLDDMEGFKSSLAKLLAGKASDRDALKKELRNELLQELESEIAPAKELAVRNRTDEVMKAIQSGLPKGEDAKKIAELWTEENQEMLTMYKEAGWSPYAVNPSLMVKDILKFYKSNAYDSLSKEKKKAIDKEVENRLKKKSEIEPSVKNTSERTEQKSSIMSEIADDLMKKAGANVAAK